mgnify:CR=1 FL=1
MSRESVVFVIGGSGYLGVELTKKLKLDFDRVVSTYNSNPFADGIKFNLLDYDDHKILIDIANDYEEINVLFLATSKKSSLIYTLAPKSLSESFDINIVAPHNLIKSFLPQMIKKKYGRVIFFSSTKAVRGDVGVSAYAASKASLDGYSRVFSKEHSKYNITSNLISLGYFDGPLWDEIPLEKRKILLNEVPSKKLGDISDIYPIILGVIKSEYTSGSNIHIDGGI